MTDHAVNEWTREDLPSEDHLLTVFRAGDPAKASTDERGGIIAVLDAVLDHLRINPGPSAREERVAVGDLRRLRRAHEIVEGERDQARDSLRSLRGAHSRLTRDYRHLSDRAEAAEARTAPAVSYDEILNAVHGNETGIYGLGQASAVADAVWSLVSGADPAVFVVRESQLPDVERNEDGDWLCEKTLVVNGKDAAEDLRGRALPQLKHVAMREAVARAIEAEQAADPVEELAGQIESATRTAIRQVCDDLAAVAPSLDPLTVERAMEVTAASRKVAAHVLGQEAGDE